MLSSEDTHDGARVHAITFSLHVWFQIKVLWCDWDWESSFTKQFFSLILCTCAMSVIRLPLVSAEDTCFKMQFANDILCFKASLLNHRLMWFHLNGPGFWGFDLFHIMHFVTILWHQTTQESQLTFVFVTFALSLQNSKNAKQCFPLTANHSCWDWVRRRRPEIEGEERLKQRVRDRRRRDEFNR